MTNKQYFLINNLDTSLSVKNAYLDIAPKGFAEIFENDVTEHSIVYAVSRNWAKISNERPVASDFTAPKVNIEVTKVFKGLTAEELKAEQEAKAGEPEKEAAKGTELGVPVEKVVEEESVAPDQADQTVSTTTRQKKAK